MKKIIKGGDAVSVYTRRDSATAVLRKLGVQQSDYNMFISQTTDGRYAVNPDKAREYLAARLRKVALEETPQKQLKGRTVKEAASNQVKRPSVAHVIRKLILDGLDNAAIFEVMKRDFGHDEDKAHYPSWYRSQMRREGLLPKDSPRDQSVKTRQRKAAKVAKKDVVNKKVKAKRKVAKPKQVRVKTSRTASDRATRNVVQTLRASMKTGNHDAHVSPMSMIVMK